MKRILAALIFASATIVNADILRVPQDYATPQEALAAASAGDTVLLSSGIYEGFDIDVAGVTVRGVTVQGKLVATVTDTVRIFDTGVMVADLKFTGGVWAFETFTMVGCSLELLGLWINSTPDGPCEIRYTTFSGITNGAIDLPDTSANITGCVFTGNSVTESITMSKVSKITVTDSLFINNLSVCIKGSGCGYIELIDCWFVDNKAEAFKAWAMVFSATRCVFEGGPVAIELQGASCFGGAPGRLELIDCLFRNQSEVSVIFIEARGASYDVRGSRFCGPNSTIEGKHTHKNNTFTSKCCLADVNGDGFLSPIDFPEWLNAYNNQHPIADQNGDRQVTPTDFTAWIQNYQTGCE